MHVTLRLSSPDLDSNRVLDACLGLDLEVTLVPTVGLHRADGALTRENGCTLTIWNTTKARVFDLWPLLANMGMTCAHVDASSTEFVGCIHNWAQESRCPIALKRKENSSQENKD